jgi:transcriptional regulator with XRE-family HTH domain
MSEHRQAKSDAGRYQDLIRWAERSPEYWREAAGVQFAEELAGRMSKQGVTRAELARRLGTSKANVTKLLGGNANFTLATMARLAAALDGVLQLHIADRGAVTQWRDRYPAGRTGKASPEATRAEAGRKPRRPDRS